LQRCFAVVVGAGLVACGGGGGGSTGTQLPAGWSALPAMPAGVGETAVAALDGKIYVAGGYNTRTDFQIYDVASSSWRTGPPLLSGTDNAGAVATGGKLYVFGGEATPAVQVYDIAGGTWSFGPDLPAPRFSSVVEAIAGKVHLIGGWSFDRLNNVSLASHDQYDPAAGAWLPGGRAPMPTARNHAASGVIGGEIYVAGGRAPGHESDGANLGKTEIYDPIGNAWRTGADLPTPRSGGASAVLDGKLYVLGGGLPGTTVYKTTERYDTAANRWERLADMPAFATGHRAVAVNGSLYVFGGFTIVDGQRQGNTGVTSAWRFTPP